MKKYIISIICYSLISMPAYCYNITDDFVEKTLNNTSKKTTQSVSIITDEFVENTLDKTLQPKKVVSHIQNDEFAEKNSAKNNICIQRISITEKVPDIKVKPINYKKEVVTDTSNLKEVQIKIKKHLSTQDNNIDEGDTVEFETANEISIGKITYPKGTTVQARIENVSLNKSCGVPADIVIGNFSIDGHKLHGEITKSGTNRSIWVYPVSAIGCAFFGLGVLVLAVRGGHAKIEPSQTYTIHLAE